MSGSQRALVVPSLVDVGIIHRQASPRVSLYPCALVSLFAQSYLKDSSSTPRITVSTIYPYLQTHSCHLGLNPTVAPNIFLLLTQVRKDFTSFFDRGNDCDEAFFTIV